MIYGFIHPGSGLGNMLHRYVATRVLALDKGVPFSMIGRENFKGSSFMNLDMGVPNDIKYHIEYPAGKIVVNDDTPLWEEKTNYYNPEFNFIEDNTVIDGEFQDERYFGHRLTEINEWLKVEPLEIPNDVCIIGFRGGEFYMFPELGLPKSYFDEGIKMMRERNPNMEFKVTTDDPKLAKEFFPDFELTEPDIGIGWRSVRYARYSIICNSSFYILPRLIARGLLEIGSPGMSGDTTIVPRYWARRNTGEWSMPQNYYRAFTYI